MLNLGPEGVGSLQARNIGPFGEAFLQVVIGEGGSGFSRVSKSIGAGTERSEDSVEREIRNARLRRLACVGLDFTPIYFAARFFAVGATGGVGATGARKTGRR